MPGISFVYQRDHSLDRNRQLTLSSLDSLLHSPLYQRELLLNTPSYLLACTRYKEYPISSFENDRFHIWVEGQIYGKIRSVLSGELNDVATLLFEDPSDTKGRVRKWLLETNGEFVIFFIKKDSNEIAIVSDALGHLPLYYCTNDGLLVLSRELRFITKFLGSFRLDKTALAQYFLFSYSLGNKSLFADIFRLDSGGVIRIHLDTGRVSIKQLVELNFEHKVYANRTLQDNAMHLIDILTEECKGVIKSVPGAVNVLGLSGGLDSRVVMLAMRNASVPFAAATRLDQRRMAASDVKVAGQLAKLFHLDWKCLELEPPCFRDALTLLRIKNGLNHLGMTFMLPFLAPLRQHYGDNIVYWTGDTGLALRRELPDERLRNYDYLLDCILRDHKIFDLNDVAALLKIEAQTLRDEVQHVLETYPEQSLGQKYVHFVMYGRTIKWHYEGMDRNRCYLWTSAPLEFTPFVNYVMNCPDAQKTNNKLYRAILERMSPESCRITYAPHGLAPSSLLFPIVRKIRSTVHKMHPSVTGLLKTLSRNNEHRIPANSLITRCIKRQMNSCPMLEEYLSGKYVERILEKGTSTQRQVLLTVTSIVEDLATSQSSLEEYQESVFI